MRFIIHELPYENPIASGVLRYFQNGQPTGALETWRLTDAADGHQFIRVDLDARAAESGRSYLYHLTVESSGQPIQLKFRLWDSNLEIIGSVLFEDDALIVTRKTKNKRYEDIVQSQGRFAFWYPATIGLGLLARLPTGQKFHAVHLNSDAGLDNSPMAPLETEIEVRKGNWETIEIMHRQKKVQPLTAIWPGQQRKIWIDENHWPLRMERPDGLTAVETRLVTYQRISKPGSPQPISN